MGADFYFNPPRGRIISLDEQVKNIIDENKEYKKLNYKLQEDIKGYKKRISELEQVISTITNLKGEK